MRTTNARTAKARRAGSVLQPRHRDRLDGGHGLPSLLAPDRGLPPIIVFSEFGDADLLISYRKSDDTWANPKSLGPTINTVNSSIDRWAPYVTDDGKFLFYSSGGTDGSNMGILWVRFDALVDSLRKTNFAPYVKSPLSSSVPPATKGTSFSYQFPEDTFFDDDGNETLTYAATLDLGDSDGGVPGGSDSLPAWLTFDPATSRFSGVPTEATSLSVQVTCTDPEEKGASSKFIITIASGN